MKKLIQHVALYQDHRVLEGQNIAIDGSRITGFPEAPKASEYDEVIDGKGMLALPGFVNTHNGLPQLCRRHAAHGLAGKENLAG